MIQVENLTKSYPQDGVKAVDDISFTVEEGSFFTLVGPSGCGKTTTLRSIAGLERPDAGLIRLGNATVQSDGVSVPTHERDIGMVFQNYAVWPHMTVYENVAFPLKAKRGKSRCSSKEIRVRVLRALEMVGLEGYEKRMSMQLSGGQQQRLSLARAVVREPRVLLLDEPLSNLDAQLRRTMRRDLKVLHHELGITALLVTHDQVEALSMSDGIAVLRNGNIIQAGTPQEVYHRPADQFVATFIGSTNLVKGPVLDSTGNLVALETPIGTLRGESARPLVNGEAAVLAVRPEAITISKLDSSAGPAAGHANHLNGRILVGLFTGSEIQYEIDVRGVRLSVRADSRVEFASGDEIDVVLNIEDSRIFPETSESDNADEDDERFGHVQIAENEESTEEQDLANVVETNPAGGLVD